MPKPPSTYELAWDGRSPSQLSDFVLTQAQLPIWSPKLISVLEGLGIDNMQYLSIDIQTGKRGQLEKSYKIANVLGLVHCLDKKHARFQTFPEDTEIAWLERYRIIEKKIKPLGRSRRAPLVFRLGEYTSHILAHETVKKAFEDNGVTGSEFVRPEKFE